LSVLPFKGAAVDHASDLGAGLTEALVTGLAGADGIVLVERGQIDVDIGELEFQHGQYVDPATRAELGKIKGAEVVIIGAVAVAGDDVRLTARYVDVESGEVLFAVKADGSASALFDLQDHLVDVVKGSLSQLTRRVRP
jgi:TolB-like protein